MIPAFDADPTVATVYEAQLGALMQKQAEQDRSRIEKHIGPPPQKPSEIPVWVMEDIKAKVQKSAGEFLASDLREHYPMQNRWWVAHILTRLCKAGDIIRRRTRHSEGFDGAYVYRKADDSLPRGYKA